MHGTLTVDGATRPADPAAVADALAGAHFFWLDLDEAIDPATADLLRDRFGFHPLAVEDAEHFGQRPKVDDYDTSTYLVVHGAPPDLTSAASPTVEVHLFVAERFVVTVHRGPCVAFDEVRARLARRHATEEAGPQVALLYLLVDSLVDSFFPVLAHVDDTIDELEDAILAQPTEGQLGQLFTLKRQLVSLRKVVTPERDMMASMLAGVSPIPGMTPEAERYFRDLYDHLIRISDLVDSYRDLLTSAMDTHLSTVSNRLNGVMKQLTIIATIFLPLSFLTGFFGQNFAWMITRITSLGAFLVLAVGVELAAAIGLLVLFRRRGWLGGSSL